MRNHGSQDQASSVITNSVHRLLQRTNHSGHTLRTAYLFWQEGQKWSEGKLLVRL